MPLPQVERYLHLLRTLADSTLDFGVRKKLFKSLNDTQFEVLCEVAVNLMNDCIPLLGDELKILKKHKISIRLLGCSLVSTQKKTEYFKNGKRVRNLLEGFLPVFVSSLLRLLEENGG